MLLEFEMPFDRPVAKTLAASFINYRSAQPSVTFRIVKVCLTPSESERERKRSKNNWKRSTNKRLTSKKIFAFAFAFAWSEHCFRKKIVYLGFNRSDDFFSLPVDVRQT